MYTPHTYFSTEFRGGKRAVRARLSNLFSSGKRRGTLLLLCAVACVSMLGTLVACRAGQVSGENPFGVPAEVYRYAMEEAGDEGRFDALELLFSYDHILERGSLEVYQTAIAVKQADPDSVVTAGGRYLDEDGYLHEERADLLLFQNENGTYTPLGRASMIDGVPEEEVSAALCASGDAALSAAGDRLLARSLLQQADEAFAPLIAAAPTEGEPWTDEKGVTWNRLSGHTKYENSRMDDDILGGLIWRFGRDEAVRLFQTYVYQPEGVFLERDGGLWVRADAADVLDWHCAGDVSTLAVTRRTEDSLTFTLEGTDGGAPCTWSFAAQRVPDSGGFQFTQYYQLSTPFYVPAPEDGKPAALVEAVRAELDRVVAEIEATQDEMARSAEALEAALPGVEIVGREIARLDMASAPALQDLVRTTAEGYVLECWRFDFRLKADDPHAVPLSGSMGLDGDGWLVNFYSMGEPALLALRDENWNYIPLGVASLSDLQAEDLHSRTARVIADGAAAQGLTLTGEAWKTLLPGLLFVSESLDAVPDETAVALTGVSRDRVDFTFSGQSMVCLWDGAAWTLSKH